jgi:hypothetical protein
MPDVETLTKFLVPALPFLYKAGDKAMDGALNKLGEDGWAVAKGLWAKLWPQAKLTPVIVAAIDGVLIEPDDADRQVVLKMALKDLLASNPELAQELAELLKSAKPLPTTQVTINSKGNKNTIVGINHGSISR